MDLYIKINKNFIILFLLLVITSLTTAHDAIKKYNHKIIHTNQILPSISNASSLTLNTTENKYNIEGNDVVDDDDDYNGTNIERLEYQNIQNINKELFISDDKITDIPKTFSVVQDWHLVCQQLCGAGLGGPTCGEPKCNEIKTEASQKYNITKMANRLLENNTDLICQDLCKYQLGDEFCSCGQRILEIDSEMDTTTDNSPLWGRNQICHSFCKYNEITITGCSICNKDENISTKLEDEEPKISSTTPNWELICKELCKSGDGGSLCNCDKPPFF